MNGTIKEITLGESLLSSSIRMVPKLKSRPRSGSQRPSDGSRRFIKEFSSFFNVGKCLMFKPEERNIKNYWLSTFSWLHQGEWDTELSYKSTISWVVTPCSLVEAHRGSPYHLLVVFLLDLLFDPEDVGDTFLRNIDGLLPNHTVLQARIP
jgi:hypothetical protein